MVNVPDIVRGSIIKVDGKEYTVRDLYYIRGEWVVATIEGEDFNVKDIDRE